MIEEIKKVLIAADPKNESAYEENTKVTIEKLNQLIAEINTELEPVKGKGYLVFHDAYQYFENRFGVCRCWINVVSPEILPDAERIREMQNKVRALDATCVFSEPQFTAKTCSHRCRKYKRGNRCADPLGASISDGSQLYFAILKMWLIR